MKHHKMNRALSSVGVGVLCGIVVACAGGDTPARNGELVAAVANFYGDGSPPVGTTGGSGGSGGSNAGNGGSAGDGGSDGGDGGSDDGGDGGSATSGSSGDGGTEAGSGGSEAGSGGSGEPACDGYQVLLSNCSGPICHNAGSTVTDFVASEDAAAGWAGRKAQSGCSSASQVVFDPENPSESLVILKLGASPPCGGPMPLGSPGDALSADDVACIEEYISTL